MRQGGPNMEVLNMLNARYFMQGDNYELNPEAYGNAWFVDTVTYVDGANAEMKTLGEINTRRVAVADKAFEKTLGVASVAVPGDTVYETSYAPNHLVYHARSAHGGILVFSEVYFPWGWHATIDGKDATLGRVNYVLRAMAVPAGSHTIEMVFDPESAKTTDAVAYCGLGVIYLLGAGALGLGLWRMRKSEGIPDKKKE